MEISKPSSFNIFTYQSEPKILASGVHSLPWDFVSAVALVRLCQRRDERQKDTGQRTACGRATKKRSSRAPRAAQNSSQGSFGHRAGEDPGECDCGQRGKFKAPGKRGRGVLRNGTCDFSFWIAARV